MKKKDAPAYGAIAAVSLLALGHMHMGSAMQYPALSIVAVLILVSLYRPSLGLIAALPLLSIIEPAPRELGWQEYVFAALLAASGCMALYKGRQRLLSLMHRALIPFLLLVLWVITNLVVALANGVTLSEWLRGLVPFVFLLYGVPVWLEMQESDRFKHYWMISIGMTAALFAYHVIKVYVGESLWIPRTFIVEHGQWIDMGTARVDSTAKNVVQLMVRVTTLLNQSTSILLPLGAIWGSWAWLLLRVNIARYFGLVLAAFSIFAMVLTYTRSMLGTSAIVITFLIFQALRSRRVLRIAILAGVLGVSAMSAIVAFSMQSIYMERVHSTVGTSEKDANITSRLEEYRIAWNMFRESPILGKGLGIKHNIQFETDKKNVLSVRVGFIHNWVMYFLMVGGGIGLLIYIAVLFSPVLMTLRYFSFTPDSVLVLATIGGMAIYGLFFAVFRLLPFNMLLGAVWAFVVYRLQVRVRT